MKEIFFAGGCFWGTEHFFSGVDGVVSAVSGYAQGSPDWAAACEGRQAEGGQQATGEGRLEGQQAGGGPEIARGPSYEQVYTDRTGFAETVKVVYRPERVSLKLLTELFFDIIDPLSVNRQGHDEGTRYRTGIYYSDEADLPVIQEVYSSVEARVGQKLAVELEPLRNFYQAEERHQKYLEKNPEGYCHLPLKTFKYLRLYQDIAAFLGDEPDSIARMAETAALIYERMKFFWVGFYIVRGDTLVLGPFQGPHACMRIGFGKGVCGTAWKEARTVVVPDVEQFPGHIACSSLSRSEIVVPVVGSSPAGAMGTVDLRAADRKDNAVGDGAEGAVGGKDNAVGDSAERAVSGKSAAVSAVLDIDSTAPGTFDSTDALWLGKIAGLLA